MKLKSLLLGSAAVLVAVSGAQAADAIIVEAEPVEYVKVCDMYGAGYFYIPGSDTCLKFGGELRVQYTTAHDWRHESNISNHDANVRARLHVSAKNDTEYGVLASNFSFSGTATAFNTGTDHDVESATESNTTAVSLVDNAQISLAGFAMGYGKRFNGKAWTGGFDGSAGIYADYSVSAGDLALTFGIADTARSGAAGQPDIYARADYAAGDLALGGSVVYDTSADAIAYLIDASYSLSSVWDGASITAFYADGDETTATEDGSDYEGKYGHLYGVKLGYKLTDSITGFTRYNELETEEGGAWRSGLTWAVASGFKISGHYDKSSTGAGKVEINFTRSF